MIHRNKEGEILDEAILQNTLMDEGEGNMLDVYYRGATGPTSFFVGLFNDTPGETDSLTDLTGEPTTNGYERQEIEASETGFPTLALDGGDFQAESKTVTFEADGGAWGPVTHAVLATSEDNSGLAVAFVALQATRTLQDGDSLEFSINIKQQ
jgi:hypothetical protein